MDNIYFSINGSTFGYDGKSVFTAKRNENDVIKKTFENILLVKIIEQYAVFRLNGQEQYIKFDGEIFSEYYNENIEEYNSIDLEIIPEQETDLPQMPVMWKQVRINIDDKDLINNVGIEDDHHWGLELNELIMQKDNFLEGKFLIGICGCTCEGCDDIMVTVGNINNNIYWDVHHEVGGGPVEIKHEYYIFNKEEYILIFNKLEKELNIESK